jgi:hypothetical protein
VYAQRKLGEKGRCIELERGLLSLAAELTTEILDYFPTVTIGPYAAVYFYEYDLSSLPEFYLARIDMLRALSKV